MRNGKIWTIWAVLAFGGVSAAQGQSEAEKAIVGMEKRMTEAALKGDLAASEAYLASDYVRVYPDGTVVPTEDVRNEVKFSALEISEEQVHVTGDTAVSVFKATVKADIHGHPIEGEFRGVRTWAKVGGEWKAVAYTTTPIGQGGPPPQRAAQALREHASVKGNVFVSTELPKMKLTLNPRFEYLGSFPFDIQGIAGGYRYVWGAPDHGKHLGRAFVIQVEGYYAGNDGIYRYGTPNPATVGGETYQHSVWIYDNDQSARERPGNESDLTRKFMQEHGYEWEPELVMSRFARIVDESHKNEIIFFYFDNLKNHTGKHVPDFPEEARGTEQKAILAKVDKASKRAFSVAAME